MRKLESVFRWVINIEICILVIVVILNFAPLLFGVRPYVVVSGSMEPAISTGSLVYVNTNTKSYDIEAGDIIAFYLGDDLFVTHRVIEVHKEEKEFITKGDANKTVDFSPVPFENFGGETIFDIPYLGYIMNYFMTRQVKLIFGGFLLVQYLFYCFLQKANNKK